MMGAPSMPESIWLDIPYLLNELDAAGISNAAVAKQLHVCRSSVHKWKQGGEIKLGHWRELVKIVELLPARKPQDVETSL